jgi:hypothetical protein
METWNTFLLHFALNRVIRDSCTHILYRLQILLASLHSVNPLKTTNKRKIFTQSPDFAHTLIFTWLRGSF